MLRCAIYVLVVPEKGPSVAQSEGLSSRGTNRRGSTNSFTKELSGQKPEPWSPGIAETDQIQ